MQPDRIRGFLLFGLEIKLSNERVAKNMISRVDEINIHFLRPN